MKPSYCPQDVTTVFKMFDLNGDGFVHIKEFEEITKALQKKTPQS